MLAPNVEATKHYHSFGIYTQTNEEVTTARQGRWRADLALADARIVQRTAGALLEELGYPLEDLGSSSLGERLRASALRAKFVGLDLTRKILGLLGVLNAGRLLHALPRGRRAEERVGSGEPVPIARNWRVVAMATLAAEVLPYLARLTKI